jgi:hypothetical protein
MVRKFIEPSIIPHLLYRTTGNSMQNALYVAADKNIGISPQEVSLMAPCFFAEQDRSAGALQSDSSLLIYDDTNWASGEYNTGPRSISQYSAYKVLDRLVDHYMDLKVLSLTCQNFLN